MAAGAPSNLVGSSSLRCCFRSQPSRRADSDSTGSGAAATPDRQSGTPNIVVIMTDDQTLASVSVMSGVRSLIAERGVTFANSIVSWSLCCPSRVTYLTGQYAQNHGVRGNLPPTGGYAPSRARKRPSRSCCNGRDTTPSTSGSTSTASEPPRWPSLRAGPSSTGAGSDFVQLLPLHLLENGNKRKESGRSTRCTRPTSTRASRPPPSGASRHSRPFFLNLAYLAPHVQVAAPDDKDSSKGHFAVPAQRRRPLRRNASSPNSLVRRGRRLRQAARHLRPSPPRREECGRRFRRDTRSPSSRCSRSTGRPQDRDVLKQTHQLTHRHRLHVGQRVLLR